MDDGGQDVCVMELNDEAEVWVWIRRRKYSEMLRATPSFTIGTQRIRNISSLCTFDSEYFDVEITFTKALEVQGRWVNRFFVLGFPINTLGV